ncbi:dynein regulatory complex subunit [Pacmanvirus S19]|nr:dynein regulatory complex subunit [Pacmanvirus S19]
MSIMPEDIVLNRLDEMQNGILCIEYLSLVELPKSPKWNEVKYLECHGNHLIELPEIPNIEELYCHSNQLAVLPEMPKLRVLYCSYNELIELPDMPNVRELDCENNQLTVLPELPKVVKLICSYNQLTVLPELPLIKKLYCNNNELSVLPELPLVKKLRCEANPLYYSEKFNKLRWMIINLITLKIYVTRWRKFNSESVRVKKQDLHTELKYSPDLPFYKETKEYQHWLENTRD